jgi:outer membrane beta-barrel protein
MRTLFLATTLFFTQSRAAQAGPMSAVFLGQLAPPENDAPQTKGSLESNEAVAQTVSESQRLVSGAPLNNPNVDVHIVERKAFSDSGKRELVLFPLAIQVNGKFTQHIGTMGSFLWHLQENFALQISGGYNWFNTESSLNAELVDKWRVEAQAATSLLSPWHAVAGVEVTPFYGKFAFFEGTLVHFSLVINGGAGFGGTRHQLKPRTTRASDGASLPETYGTTGLKFMGQIGAGLRLQLGEHFALRFEVRDVVYTARVEQINGCNLEDLKALDAALKAGRPLEGVSAGGGCQKETFIGEDNNGVKRNTNVPLALNLVKLPSSDVLNNVGVYLGISVLF